MKFTIEMNPSELRAALRFGVLSSLCDLVQETESKTAVAAAILNGEVKPVQTQNVQQVQQQPIQQVQQQSIQQYPVPPQQPVTQPTMQQPAGIPTAEQTYSIDQIAVAATQLNDTGKRNELVQLLNGFGVQSLTALPKERYGEFALQLRQMGANI